MHFPLGCPLHIGMPLTMVKALDSDRCCILPPAIPRALLKAVIDGAPGALAGTQAIEAPPQSTIRVTVSGPYMLEVKTEFLLTPALRNIPPHSGPGGGLGKSA